MDSTAIIQYWKSKYYSPEVHPKGEKIESFLNGMLSAFSPGHSYHYVVNFKTLKLQFVSKSVVDFVGVHPESVTFEDIISTADKSQASHIKLKEEVIYDFLFNFLPRQDVVNYKLVYLYKMRDPKGQLRTILHQALPIGLDSHGNLENVISVHTDVTYLNISPDDSISFFSLNGNRSFININTEAGKFDPENVKASNIVEELTSREQEIVSLLAKGLSSKEISSRLHISTHTVQKHRKNILLKTKSANSTELIGKCIMAGMGV